MQREPVTADEVKSMFAACANPDCRLSFNYREGRLFRFHKAYPTGSRPPNTHAVQHFWLCRECSAKYTLEYADRGVVLLYRSDVIREEEVCRIVASA